MASSPLLLPSSHVLVKVKFEGHTIPARNESTVIEHPSRSTLPEVYFPLTVLAEAMTMRAPDQTVIAHSSRRQVVIKCLLLSLPPPVRRGTEAAIKRRECSKTTLLDLFNAIFMIQQTKAEFSISGS